jgi:hypothetical protein
MSVEDPDVVDVIGTDRATDDVILTVSDHLEWDEELDYHLEALRKKLESYLNFIVSGQIDKDYAGAVGRRIRIELALKYAPNAAGDIWLDAAREQMRKKGYSLSWNVFEET